MRALMSDEGRLLLLCFGTFSVVFCTFFGHFCTFSVVFCTLFRASLVAKEAFVNAFGLPRLAFGICLTA